MECFSTSPKCPETELTKLRHKGFHQFIVVDPNAKSVFRKNWDSNEEVLLLNAIKILGMNNWNEISEWLTNHDAAEIEVHYMQTYIQSTTNPYPLKEILEPAVPPPPPNYNTLPQESCPSEGHEKRISLKGKKERTNAAEYSGWMACRHEFEMEYNNDAEDLVTNIVFANESQQSFEEKVAFLVSYNTQLDKRRKYTSIIEGWDIHHIDIKGGKGDFDLETKIFGCTSKEQKEIATKLIPFCQYMPEKEIIKIFNDALELVSLNEEIDQCLKWHNVGVRNVAEGQLLDLLETCIHDGKMTMNDADNWNRAITNFNRDNKLDVTPDLQLLSQSEIEMCSREKIDLPLYFIIKDLILREYAFRGGLKRDEALEMCPVISNKIGIIYDMFLAKGYVL